MRAKTPLRPTALLLLAAGALAAGLSAPLGAAAPPAKKDLDPDLLRGLTVRSIGPAGMSGRIAAVAGVPGNPQVLWAGAATGGVWKSTNDGVSWTPVFDDQPVAAIGAVAVFAANPDIVWVGTGEGNVRNSASVGNGVYRSSDGGRTWKHLGLDATERIHRIALHPTDPDVAYVCAPGREWGENPERGVFKTSDAGKTWQKVLYADERTGCGELVMDPGNPEKLFAGLWQFRRWPYFFRSGGPSSGLFVSHDGGATWKQRDASDGLPEGVLGRIGLAIAPSSPNVVYALVEADQSALLRSTDGGVTFSSVNTKPEVAPRPFYFADIHVDPELPDRLYSLEFGVQVSEDGGKSFQALPAAGALHGDFHALWIDPHDGRRMVFGDDGGVGVSSDRGATARHVRNLPLAQFYHVAVDQEVPYNVMGGLQDNGSWRGPSSVPGNDIRNWRWQMVGGGDGFDVQPDPQDANLGYSMSQGGYLARWNVATGEYRDVRPLGPEGTRLRFHWNAALALDPFEPQTLYYGSQFVHKSSDRGESWMTLSPDLTTNNPEWQKQRDSGGLTPDVTAAENHCTLLTIAPSPKERGVIWTGSDDGRIHVTRDGGKTWTSVEANLRGAPKNTWVGHIEASPHSAGEAYAILDDHRRSNWAAYVFKTTDYGKTWTNLADEKIRGWALVIEQDPVDRDLLFLGTEFGLYVTFDGGKKWHQWKSGLPTVSVMDLVIHPREHDLVIATHGRALYILDDIRPLRDVSPDRLTQPLKLFPVADAVQVAGPADLGGGYALGSGEFAGTSRPYGAIITYSLSDPGLPLQDPEKQRARKARERVEKLQSYPWGPASAPAAEDDAPTPPKVVVEILDTAGKTVRTLEGTALQGINRVVWGLERDGGTQLPAGPNDPPAPEHPAGPEVSPGPFTVRVKFGEHEAQTSVTVVPNPKASYPPGTWEAREAAYAKVERLREALAQAITAVREAQQEVGVVLARAGEGEKGNEKEKDGDKKDAGEGGLEELGKKVKEQLTALERRFWQAPEAKGIQGDDFLLYDLFGSYGNFLEPRPPSPTHVERLRRLEAAVATYLADLQALVTGDLAAFQELAKSEGVGFFAKVKPVELPPNP